jgi:phytoene dehydrogenase-like protein
MQDSDVVIVGAGLTGLRAALEISRAGLSVLVIERNAAVGGRMRTSNIRGAMIDNGFQVLLTGYPEFKTLPDLSTLGCRSFMPGARIRVGSTWRDLIDPRREPLHFLRSIRAPVGSPVDLMRLGLCVYLNSNRGVKLSGSTTAKTLDRWGFSSGFLTGFLKPFLSGVLLDPSLHSDAALALFYLRIFFSGDAALPATGIQALPELLASNLGRQHILLSTAVTAVERNRAVLENGEDLAARYVICASDALSAAALGGPEQTVPFCGNTTIYFLADRPPYSEPILVLNGDGIGPINNLAVLTNIQPSYARSGQALISASVVGSAANQPKVELVSSAREQLFSWFGSQVSSWEHVINISIPNALPARPRCSHGWVQQDGVFYAGDYLSYGSQNGALLAGRSVAQAILSREF